MFQIKPLEWELGWPVDDGPTKVFFARSPFGRFTIVSAYDDSHTWIDPNGIAHYAHSIKEAQEQAERMFVETMKTSLLQIAELPPVMYGQSPRSPQWTKERNAFLDANPTCAACGCKKRQLLNVHHKKPYHLQLELELLRSNLITLCEQPSHNCHFYVGHLLNWSAYNPNVEEDAKTILYKIQNRMS